MEPPYQVLSVAVPVWIARSSYRVTIPNRLPPPLSARKRSACSLDEVAVTRVPFVKMTSSSLIWSAAYPHAVDKKLRPPPSNSEVPTSLRSRCLNNIDGEKSGSSPLSATYWRNAIGLRRSVDITPTSTGANDDGVALCIIFDRRKVGERYENALVNARNQSVAVLFPLMIRTYSNPSWPNVLLIVQRTKRRTSISRPSQTARAPRS